MAVMKSTLLNRAIGEPIAVTYPLAAARRVAGNGTGPHTTRARSHVFEYGLKVCKSLLGERQPVP